MEKLFHLSGNGFTPRWKSVYTMVEMRWELSPQIRFFVSVEVFFLLYAAFLGQCHDFLCFGRSQQHFPLSCLVVASESQFAHDRRAELAYFSCGDEVDGAYETSWEAQLFVGQKVFACPLLSVKPLLVHRADEGILSFKGVIHSLSQASFSLWASVHIAHAECVGHLGQVDVFAHIALGRFEKMVEMNLWAKIVQVVHCTKFFPLFFLGLKKMASMRFLTGVTEI